ncbi:unnamed protein product, partial [Owenia fusiformis]
VYNRYFVIIFIILVEKSVIHVRNEDPVEKSVIHVRNENAVERKDAVIHVNGESRSVDKKDAVIHVNGDSRSVEKKDAVIHVRSGAPDLDKKAVIHVRGNPQGTFYDSSLDLENLGKAFGRL